MEELFIFLFILFLGCVLCGPIAIVISIIALKKSGQVYRKFPEAPRPAEEKEVIKPVAAAEKLLEVSEVKPPAEVAAPPVETREKPKVEKVRFSLEQRIGTRWVLIAGIIAVVFSVGFFLKYAYDNNLIGPLGRVMIAAVSGLIALAVGEVTRRRGYGIVAKGVTALGFAILYAAVFSAYRFYGLIDSVPAFALSILITVAAMLYAVSLNEIIVAILSLLGGFLTPVLVSTGENLPMPLFTYVLILGIGAMLCTYYRKWRAVNLLAFVGTFVLYTGWFEKFYRPEIHKPGPLPEQAAIALGWLGVFFAVYLVLPVLYELIRKVKAHKEDVLLVIANALVVFYYLWAVLFDKQRAALAFCAVGLCVAHLAMMGIVIRRCKEDVNLRVALLLIGLFFLTIAIPLYLKMYAIAIAWAAEGVVLAVIGLKYRSIWTQVSVAVAFSLSFGKLMEWLPMHSAAFTLALNPIFGTWCFVVAALVVCHILYRTNKQLPQEACRLVSEVFYAAAALLLMLAASMEWYWHCDYNIGGSAVMERYFMPGMMLAFTFFTLVLLVRPASPSGMLSVNLATILAGIGSIFTMVTFTEVYRNEFVIFVNWKFLIALVYVGGLFLGAWLLKHIVEQKEGRLVYPLLFALAGIFVLWIILTEQIYLYWYCKNWYAAPTENWRFLAHMYISVMWALYGAALMIVGFWKRASLLRYIALGLFALLLGKVFFLDTSEVKSVYRIAGFLATGVTLVAVSYLYQYVRKKGFFEMLSAGKGPDE
ncbi:MAG: DUF2339 domain-containing protein [Planctomycetota bacterium]|jgi:uncharacterized membrane protein